ncbi:MAG TPA: hypothetical protein VFG91_04090 [Woeseiaceae bacterium]|nr:hypothetical protein [Woeseiaceae bacterium]
MAKQFVKKYRTKRTVKWLKRRLLPLAMRARKTQRRWRRKDRQSWPPAGAEPAGGLQQYEYSLLSQNGEDGILRFLFSEIGFDSRHFVEFGFGAHQCNSLRLILHEHFRGLLMDGSRENCDFFDIAAAKRGISGVDTVCTFLDRDNLEPLILEHGTPHEIDLLSLDVDGNDYWFWEALERISPRVVSIEYNAGIGPTLSWTVPYDPQFERFAQHASGFFHGASLKALEKLGRRKGYRLVGCDSTGTNAFFLRDDVAAPRIATLTSGEAYRPHANWLGRGFPEAEQLEIMKGMPYVEV